MIKIENTAHLTPIDSEKFTLPRLSDALFAQRPMNRQLKRHAWRQYYNGL